MNSQIILLHVQGKVRNSIAAMQALHDVCQNFVKLYRMFRRSIRVVSLFLCAPSYFASAKCGGCPGAGPRKPLANVPFSC